MNLNFSKTLLVEDEVALSVALRHGLERLGLKVAHAWTLKSARTMVQDSPPELVVLDRNLPDGDGLELCRELRDSGYLGAILVLTAEGRTSSVVEGLQQGADDYLAKPFSWDELTARIAALDRRIQKTPAASKWQLDAANLKVWSPLGKWTTLTPLEFKLLEFFIAHAGKIVSRSELLREVWGFSWIPKTRTVDLFLTRMRKMFEIDEKNPIHFHTIRGAGYRFDP